MPHGGRIMVPKAVLIQDIPDYLIFLKEAMRPAMELYAWTGLTTEDVIEWIIAEQLEEIYHLFTVGHRPNINPYRDIYHMVRNNLQGRLDVLTSGYISAPRVYANYREIQIAVRGIDLYIWYYK